MKFKVGDIVKIRKPREGDPDWIDGDMDKYDGFVGRVTKIPEHKSSYCESWTVSYQIENCGEWTFHEDWLTLHSIYEFIDSLTTKMEEKKYGECEECKRLFERNKVLEERLREIRNIVK